MNAFPGMEINIPEFSIIDIKYDGPSFGGVMDIGDLGNELLGFEYCIKEIFKKLKLSDKKFEEIQESDLVILVEPFQNNCFRKKIKIGIKWIEKHPATSNVITILLVASISGLYVVISSLSGSEVKQITENDIPPQVLERISDNIQAELLTDPKFRKEIAKIAIPLSDKNDLGEIRTKDIEGNEKLVVIDRTNKDNFLAIGGYEKTIKEEITCYEKRETLYGRMNAIDVDATKRQIGFKLNGEGSEIDCTLATGLNINDYKGLIGGWVNIEGIVYYDGIIPKKIDVENISSATAPLREAKNISLDV